MFIVLKMKKHFLNKKIFYIDETFFRQSLVIILQDALIKNPEIQIVQYF